MILQLVRCLVCMWPAQVLSLVALHMVFHALPGVIPEISPLDVAPKQIQSKQNNSLQTNAVASNLHKDRASSTGVR